MQLWLEISTSVQANAWQHSQIIQSPGGRWQVYVNQLCLRTLLDWLLTEKSINGLEWSLDSASPARWELVNGSVITFGDKRLALIPIEGIGHDEIEVPQEWIDIDSWAADYYLALQINVEEGWLEGWGYTTHQRLKTLGDYDSMERLYCIGAEALVQDTNALWTTLEFCPQAATQADVEPLAELSQIQANGLIEQLSTAEFPRLSVPFLQWGALLANETWYQQLQEQRLNALNVTSEAAVAATRLPLNQYLQTIQEALLQSGDLIIAAGWQSVEAVFGSEASQLAFSFRSEEQTIGRQAKLIQLGSESDQSVRLVMLWQREPDGRLAIQAQLYPNAGELYLPPNITFSLMSDQDEALQSVQSELENNYIQLKRFRCPINYAFGIEVQLENLKITERFVA
ncbi:MAG: DUF1822 family protein [Cyanobacteria bacterium J06649_4]